MKSILVAVLAFLITSSAFASGEMTVIAKYDNWYRGDDDYYAQCMVVSNGRTGANRLMIFQGLPGVNTRETPVSLAKLEKLEKLRETLPADSVRSSYSGYNFLETKSDDKPHFEILGQAPGVKGNLNYDQYFTVSKDSEAARVLKSICNME